MGTTKHRKDHKKKLVQYKDAKKKEQEFVKKKMIDNYIKMQQEKLANQESHTSTEEVSGPEINLDDLNMVQESVLDDLNMVQESVLDNVIDVEPIIEIVNDNNNQ